MHDASLVQVLQADDDASDEEGAGRAPGPIFQEHLAPSGLEVL